MQLSPSRDFNLKYPKPIHGGFLIIRSLLSHRHQTIPKLGVYKDKVIFSGERVDNVYVIDLNKIDNKDIKCLMSISHDIWTWHRRLRHAKF